MGGGVYAGDVLGGVEMMGGRGRAMGGGGACAAGGRGAGSGAGPGGEVLGEGRWGGGEIEGCRPSYEGDEGEDKEEMVMVGRHCFEGLHH